MTSPSPIDPLRPASARGDAAPGLPAGPLGRRAPRGALAVTAGLVALLAGGLAARAASQEPPPPARPAQPPPAAPAPLPGALPLDARESRLLAFLYKDGVAARLAHDHVVQATELEGELAWDPARPADLAVRVVARASSLVADPPALVAEYRVQNDLDPGDRAKVTATLRGRDQLDVARFPTIAFESTGARAGPAGELLLEGRFTLRGVTRPVRCVVTLARDGDVVRGEATFRLRQRDFGYEPYSALLGAIRVQDQVTIRARLVARPPTPAR